MPEPTWKEFTQRIVTDFCNERGLRTFTLQELQDSKSEEILAFKDSNNHPFDKIRQQLQFLRKDGILSFLDNRGSYTLREPVILKHELAEEAAPFIRDEKQVEKREYWAEVFARDRGWVKQAKDRFGCYCLHPKCENTFMKPDGTPYIEVHHIVPLFNGGEDALWNLTVLCAHHHKMAHFSDNHTKNDLENLFLKITEERL